MAPSLYVTLLHGDLESSLRANTAHHHLLRPPLDNRPASVIHWCLFLESVGRCVLLAFNTHPVFLRLIIHMLWAYSEESEPAATATSHMTPAETRTGCTAMHPKTMRQQSPQHDGDQRGTSARKSSQRAQSRASMATEYRERFLPHSCHTTFFITSVMKGPNHPLKAMSNNVAK